MTTSKRTPKFSVGISEIFCQMVSTPSLLPNLTPRLVLLSQSKVFTTVKNESLGDITLSDVKYAAVNNFKNNKPYSPKW